MTSYATLATFKAAMGVGDTDSDTDIQRCLDAATEWISSPEGAGRQFGAATNGTRYFVARDMLALDVPELATITSLAVDTAGDDSFSTTLTDGTSNTERNYYLEPLNVGQPDVYGGYQRIRIWPTSGKTFDVGHQVKIVGTWGYGSVPKSIEQACILLANRLLQRQKSPFGTIEAPDAGVIARISRADPDIDRLLAPYRSPQGAGSWVIV